MGATSSVAREKHEGWSVDEACNWLRTLWLEEFETRFRDAGVNGHKLLHMEEQELVRLLKLDEVHAQSLLGFIGPLRESVLNAPVTKGMTPADMAKPISADDFDMQRRVGKGSFGDVWQALCRRDGQQYAVKILDKAHILQTDTLDSVLQERELLSFVHQESHCPFIVELKFAFQDEKKLYLVLSLVRGGDLYSLLKRTPENKLPIEVVRFYTAELIIAIQWMHDKRVAYRDLKAENVMIDYDGHVVVTDLGLARRWDDDMDMHSTSIVGTPEYMPPEIIREEGHGNETDFWGIGILVFEMLTGKTPFSAGNAKGLFVNILVHEPQFPDYIPEDARDLISKLLHKSPSCRFGAPEMGGFTELMAHEFFSSIDWDKLRKKEVQPPTATGAADEDARVSHSVESLNMAENAPAGDGDSFGQFQVLETLAEEKEATPDDESKDDDKVAELHRQKTMNAGLKHQLEEAEHEAEHEKDKVNLVLDLVPHMICSKDLTGKYLLANTAMAASYGLQPKQLVGRLQGDLAKNKEEAENMMAADRMVAKKGGRMVHELTLRNELGGTRNRPRTLRITKIPYKQQDGSDAVMAIGEDITQHKEYQRALQEKLHTMELQVESLKKQNSLLEHQLALAAHHVEAGKANA